MQTFRQPCLLLCKRRRLHRFAENRPALLSLCSPPQNQPFRVRVSRSCAIAARSRRPVTGIHSPLGLQIYRANTYLPISDRLVLRECRTVPLRASLHCSAYAVRHRTSRSGFGLTQLFANKSAPRQTVTGKAEPHGLTAAKKNARKRSFSPKPAVTITVMQVFDCGAIPVRQPTVHDSQP